MSADAATRAAVRVENQVVYGYGVIGAHLRGPDRALATRRLAAHQQLRDQLSASVRDAPGAAPAYELPAPVTDATTARSLAVGLEDAAARAAWALVAAAGPDTPLRQAAVTMLADVAAAAAQWRARAGRTDDPALPGQPGGVASQPSTTVTTSPSSSTTASGSTS